MSLVFLWKDSINSFKLGKLCPIYTYLSSFQPYSCRRIVKQLQVSSFKFCSYNPINVWGLLVHQSFDVAANSFDNWFILLWFWAKYHLPPNLLIYRIETLKCRITVFPNEPHIFCYIEKGLFGNIVSIVILIFSNISKNQNWDFQISFFKIHGITVWKEDNSYPIQTRFGNKSKFPPTDRDRA